MRRAYVFLAAGIILIAAISILEGFAGAFAHAIEHLKLDTGEWAVHMYILGWIFLVYGIYAFFRK